MATDVGAWRVVLPVLRELRRRQAPCRVMLAEPSASLAGQDGVEYERLTAPTLAERADAVVAANPSALLLGTSAKAVVERELVRRLRAESSGAELDGAGPDRPGAPARPRLPTLGILDAMLFVERRFGAGLAELPDVVACPDEATAERLHRAGAPNASLVVTGNPTLEEIGLTAACDPPNLAPDRPVDVLFVSSPVSEMRLRGAIFAIDEREALDDVLAALVTLRKGSPAGFHVRVRLHPVQSPDRLPEPPPGITLVSDDDLDRLRSCARASVVVGLSSTLLGEARFLPRPAIAYLPGPFWEQERVFSPEYGVALARSRDDLIVLLAEALQGPPVPAPLAHHLGAAGRIADLLTTLASPR